MQRYRRLAVVIAAAAVLVVVASLPTTTSVGVDFKVSTYQIPLYEKAIMFVSRDLQLRRVASQAVAGAGESQEDRALSILRWVHGNVRPQPPGLPVVDDHTLNVVIRGYGNSDQAADVFATLVGYQGISGALAFARRPDGGVVHAVAYAQVDGDWRVFDVRGGFPLRDGAGRLASLDQLRAFPELTRTLASPEGAGGIAYPEIVKLLPNPPGASRSDDQTPFGRLLAELGRLTRR
ncbi:MAG: hypothetical protein FJ034_00090 [Chloroflexi bacterium]|nr:hypothetical protein [Chloroflexota bacterium]